MIIRHSSDFKTIGLTGLLLFSCFHGFSQKRLVLIHRNDVITSYMEGERIRFVKKYEKQFNSGTIIGIHDGYIKVNQDSINIYRFKKVDLKGKIKYRSLAQLLGTTFIASGVVYLLANWINYNRNSKLNIHDSYVPYVLIAVGITIKLVSPNNRYFKVGRWRKISVF